MSYSRHVTAIHVLTKKRKTCIKIRGYLKVKVQRKWNLEKCKKKIINVSWGGEGKCVAQLVVLAVI